MGAALLLLLLVSWRNYSDLSGSMVRRDLVLASAPHGGESFSIALANALWHEGGEFYNSPAGEGLALYNGPGQYEERFVNDAEPGRMSHVSTIAPLTGGAMMAAWYSGSREGAKDVNIYTSVFADGRWSAPRELVSRASARDELGRYVRKVGNPMLVRGQDGRLWMFYASIVAGGWSGTSINYKYSDDDGRSWSRSVKMVLSPFMNLTNNVKNKALPLVGGGLLLPVYHELLKKRSELILFMPDGRYTASIMTRRGRAVQPSLVRKEGRRLGAFFRNMSGVLSRRVLYAESQDMGRNWGPLMNTTLKNPNAGLDVIDLDGYLLTVLNNNESDRHRLTLEYSADGGRTWNPLHVFEDSEGGEFSYPFMARGLDGIFHVTYTYDRKHIKHIRFDALWLASRMKGGARGGAYGG